MDYKIALARHITARIHSAPVGCFGLRHIDLSVNVIYARNIVRNYHHKLRCKYEKKRGIRTISKIDIFN